MTPEKQQQKDDLELQIKELETQLAPSSDAIARQVGIWKQHVERKVQWEIVSELNATAQSGAAMDVSENGVVTVKGEATAKDVYELVFSTKLKDIKAVRLEALANETLPGKGPGRGGAGPVRHQRCAL